MDDGSLGVALDEPRRGAGLHGRGRPELQDPEDRVEAVAAHVAYRAGAEIAPAPPDEGQVRLVERTLGSGSEPQVPIEPIGHGLGISGSLETLRPEGAARPVDDLGNGSDRAVPYPFAE